MAVAGAPPLPPGSRAALLLGEIDASTADAVWRLPYFAWIEHLGTGDAALAEVVRRALACDFFYSFGAAASAELPLAGRVVGFISGLLPEISIERLQDMELALHEAVSNALVHGNLGVGSMRELSINALDEYSRSMSRGLADPGLARRRVEVAGRFDGDGVVIDVVDEGTGYDASLIKGQGACGRGLELIAAVAQHCEVCDGGRRLSMRFRV